MKEQNTEPAPRPEFLVDIGSGFEISAFGERYLPHATPASIGTTPITEQYDEKFGKYFFEDNAFYTVIGTDSGLLIKYVLEQGIPSGTSYLFVELDNVIPQIEQDLVTENLKSKIRICAFKDWQDQAIELNIGNYIYGRRNLFYRSLAAQEGISNAYSELSSAVEEEMANWVFLHNIELESEVFSRHQLNALPENIYPADLLRNSCPDRTAIILAGGPSLDNFIPWLKQGNHRDQVLLIAVSRISKRLQIDGIVPDVFVSVDPQEVSYIVSKECLYFPPDTIFAISCTLTQKLSAQWHGKQVYMGPRYPHTTDKNPDNISVIGPTVTNSAIELAAYMGASNIVLAGVDLCYSDSGHSHATGSIEADIGHFFSHIDLIVETNSGGQADTNKGYFTAINMISMQAQRLKDKCKIITIAEHGAKINKIDYVPLSELKISNPFPSAIRPTINNLIPSDKDRRYVIDIYNQMKQELGTAISALDKIHDLANEAKELNTGLYNAHTKIIDTKKRFRLSEIEKSFKDTYDHLCQTIVEYNSSTFSNTLSGHKADDEWEVDEVISQMEAYYSALAKGSVSTKHHYTLALEEINKRAKEEDTPPDIKSLISYWNKNKIPGRARTWIAQHSEAYNKLSANEKQLLADQDQVFEKSLAQDMKDFASKTYDDKNFHLKILIGQLDAIQQRFLQKNLTSLKRIQNNLRPLKTDWGLQLYHLVSGYISELERQPKSAAIFYQNVQDEPYWITKQYALERQLMLAMELAEIDMALDCLDQLSHKLDSYQPFYAQLLNQAGRSNAAINVYTEYLTKHPNDIEIMADLGLIFKLIGNQEGLYWAREHIKALSPAYARLAELQD